MHSGDYMKAVIFDLDGTLLNTIADISHAANAALALHGYPIHPIEAYCQMVGNGFPTLMRRAVPQQLLPNLCADDLDKLVGDARNYYVAHPSDHTQPYPGISETLEVLHGAGLQLAVLSNKMDDLTNVLIRKHFPAIPFAKVLGSRPGIKLKPDPTVLLAILEELGVSSGESMYVGDSNVDVATAHNAQMKVIGVAWGFRGRQELEECGADHIIEHAAEMLPLVGAA